MNRKLRITISVAAVLTVACVALLRVVINQRKSITVLRVGSDGRASASPPESPVASASGEAQPPPASELPPPAPPKEQQASIAAQDDRSPRLTKAKTAFNALPRGTQKFDGVTFRIQGPVNIIGTRAAQAGGKEFARVSNSSIRGRGNHIHVLHTGDHGSSPTGNFIWRLVLHYADGETRRFDFAYGVHIRNLWRRENERDIPPSDPDSSIVWVGTSDESDRKGADLVVSRTTLPNPRPNVEVTSADFVSLLGQSSAYVFAVTVSDYGPNPVAGEPRSALDVPPLSCEFEDTEGRPETHAALNCVFECNGFSVRLAPALADPVGQVTIDVPTEVVSAIRYDARDPAGRIERGRIEIAPRESGWRPHVIRFHSE
jgi:hypothetical protein